MPCLAKSKLLRCAGFVLLTGCAAQSNLVDLEVEVDALRRHQQEIQGRLTQIEELSKSPKKVESASGQVDALEARIRTLLGRVEENEHLVARAVTEGERQFRLTQTLVQRIDTLESRVLEKGLPRPNSNATPATKPTDLGGSLSPEEAYRVAYDDYLKGNDDLAAAGFQAFMKQYPTSYLVPQALYFMGESHYHKKAYEEAISFFNRVQQEHPTSRHAPGALLKEGFAYLELGDHTMAKRLLKDVIERFPNSEETMVAKDRLTTLR